VLPEARYSEIAPQSRAVTTMVDALAREPGVAAAGWVVGTPLSGGCCMGHGVVVEGEERPAGERRGTRVRLFHGDYFGALATPVVRGRAPAANDFADGERVAWVNRAFARSFFGDADPVGRRIAWRPGEATDAALGPQWMRIAGVVEDYRAVSMREGDEVAVYAPYVQRDDNWVRFGHLVARVEGDPSAYREALERAVAAADAAVPLAGFETLRERVQGALARDRFALQLVGGFGAIALLLGLQGVFGVVAFTVERRRAEIALRLALGAPASRAASMVLRDGAKQVLAGLLAGVAGALVAGRMAESLLHGVDARDPLAFLVAILALAAAGALAVWLPARRATRVEPMAVLRAE
jgi:putative ABC transport system permease protein